MNAAGTAVRRDKSEATPRTTSRDVLDAPAHRVAEIVDGTLYTQPRPAVPHAGASSSLEVKTSPTPRSQEPTKLGFAAMEFWPRSGLGSTVSPRNLPSWSAPPIYFPSIQIWGTVIGVFGPTMGLTRPIIS